MFFFFFANDIKSPWWCTLETAQIGRRTSFQKVSAVSSCDFLHHDLATHLHDLDQSVPNPSNISLQRWLQTDQKSNKGSSNGGNPCDEKCLAICLVAHSTPDARVNLLFAFLQAGSIINLEVVLVIIIFSICKISSRKISSRINILLNSLQNH